MSKPKFNIGDTIYHARCDRQPVTMECPDCGGTARIRVILHNEEEVSIACRSCASGYDDPTGRVQIYNYVPEAIEMVIDGMEINASQSTRYRSRRHILDEDSIFSSKEEALVVAKEKQVEHEKEQQEKINKKEKPTKDWAWNASYHRQQIKRALKDLEHHRAALAVADLKRKKLAEEV